MKKILITLLTISTAYISAGQIWTQYDFRVDTPESAAKIVAASDELMASSFAKSNFKGSSHLDMYLANGSNTATHSFDNAESLDDKEVFEPKKLNDSGVLQRIALKEILKQNRITAQIPLRTDLSVGMIIKFGIATPEVMGEGTKYDKANDDRYLITDMSLSASPSSKQGVLTLECVKQSYAEKLEELTPLEEAPPAEQEESATFFNSRG